MGKQGQQFSHCQLSEHKGSLPSPVTNFAGQKI